MKEEKIWELIILKLSGEASPEQEADLEEAMKQSPDLVFPLGILEGIWKSKPGNQLPGTADRFNRHLQRLSNHLSEDVLQYDTAAPASAQPSSRKKLYRRVLLAGAMAACLALGLIMVLHTRHRQEKAPAAAAQHQVYTKKGARSTLHLPDGTEVWLNAGSKVSYENNFAGGAREVTLEGEAFFDVAKDPDRPFIIHTDMIDIRVLGTALNVRAYADEKATETALIRGAVEITLHRSPEKRIVLRPDEKLVVRNDSPALTKPLPIMTLTQVHYLEQDQEPAPMETLWMKNKLVFDDEPLQQVALKLERWYDVKVIIADKALEQVEYSGVFENEDISQVLYALQLTGNFHYTIRGKVITIGQ
ncbi:FecR family protein [Chitinophaga japonensis]|uniref:FecR family protein n=1 Tax=Chitinophaga japonensis TaxID=104662 RepID=A0A562T4K0_CHIJA|nr:FecR domain-containing protein [Chitinophaga japonensis]TWI87986.1 FecR family protein [Chitinophaga japonensis]